MINFTKMNGLGNDYIYIDSTNGKNKIPEENLVEFIKYISDRHFGVGSDGVIFIKDAENPENDFKMSMYNADGSQGEMCGNGIRCVGKYVYDYKLTNKKNLKIETLAGIKYLQLTTNEEDVVKEVTVNMGNCTFEDEEKLNQTVVALEKVDMKVIGTVASMGNPHFVVFVDDVDNFEVEKIGPMVEKHPYFPNKTNVEFIQVLNRDKVKMRVWERGSGETFACGTGACAVFSTCNKMGLVNDESIICLIGGDLKIRIDRETNNVYMTGPAEKVCDGTIERREWGI